MAFKVDRLVTYGGGIPSSKSHNLVITWSRDKWKMSEFMSTISIVIKLGSVVTYHWKTPHTCSGNILITFSRDKCKTYLRFYNIYGHQTWQSSNLRFGNPTFQVTWPFDYVVTSHCKSNNLYLHFHNIYGHQKWQSGNLQLKDPTH